MSGLRVLLRPRMLLLHTVALLAVATAGWLGWWQVSAWQEQREDRALAIAADDPQPLTGLLGADDPFPAEHVGRPVELEGEWVADSTFVVEQRRRSAQAPDDGLWQAALLAVCPPGSEGCTGAPVIPVVLGWTPSQLEAPDAPEGAARLRGWLQPAEQSGADPDPGDDSLPTLRTADLLQRTPNDVYSGYVILDEPAELRANLVAVTPQTLPDPPASTALRNLLYGLEWWVFAGFAAYLWWRWSRDEVAEAGAGGQARPVASSA